MIFVRADGNAKIGAGHIMRCLTIVSQLKRQKTEKIRFICADSQSASLAQEYGFSAWVLETDYREMESELPFWQQLWQDGKFGNPEKNVILVDSYYITKDYLQAIACYGKIVLMDDMAKQSYPVTEIINYNASADRTWYEQRYAHAGVKCLVGTEYVPLREQFCNREYCVNSQVKKVLITTGGGDLDNIAGKLLEMLWEESKEYHVVIGQFNPHFSEMKQLEKEKKNVILHSNVKDMAGLMLQMDLAITAGGSTIYELAALGVPFICFSYAPNQEPLTKYMGTQGIGGFAGAYHLEEQKTMEEMFRLFWYFDGDETIRKRMSALEKCLVDGQGAKRLAEELWNLSL